MSEVRMVEFSHYFDDRNSYAPVVPPKKGFFHLWGEDSVSADDGILRFTFAIVEAEEDGQVYKVPPDSLKFLKTKVVGNY